MIKEWQLAAFASYRWPQRILEAFLLLSAFGGGLPGRPAAMRRLYILENNENTLISWIRRSNRYKLISGLMRYLHSVRFSFDVFEHMTDAKQILFGNWLNPFVFFHFQYWFIALQIKKTCNETHAISISSKANVCPWILPISGGKTVNRLFWMWSSRNLVNSPISRGISSKSLSRNPS